MDSLEPNLTSEDTIAAALAAYEEARCTGTNYHIPEELPPDEKARFERALALVDLLGEISRKPTSVTNTPSTQTPPNDTSPHSVTPSQIERFKIRRELGRGGMGIVYLAEDPQLNRLVALKVLHNVDSRSLDRLRAEAHALAKLNHLHAVAVYECGLNAQQPYIAMEYVAGYSLRDAILKGTFDPWRGVRILIDVSEAIQAAHEAKILHRDLKPANILLNRVDQPKVSDFGLALMVERSSGLTSTGVVLGTPSYMAPEQVRGDSTKLGPATDVYGLGATLYEILTGRPPFVSNRPHDVFLQVLFDDPIPPRRLNPSVSRDLETICLKCLEKNPAARYPTAEAFGSDLRRLITGKPILARRIGWLGQTWRWAKRQPTLAALSAAFAFALIFGTSGSWFYATQASENAQLAQSHLQQSLQNERLAKEAAESAQKNAEDAQAARALAEQTAIELRRTIRDFFLELSQNERLQDSGLDELRRELLLKAKIRLVEIAQTLDRRPEMRGELAETLHRLADLETMLGNHRLAIGDWVRARDLYQQLAANKPNDWALQEKILQTTIELGGAHCDLAQTREAEAECRSAITLAKQLVQSHPSSLEMRRLLAKAYMSWGNWLNISNHYSAAIDQHLLAHSELIQLLADGAKSRESRELLATIHHNLGSLYIKSGNVIQGLGHYQTAATLSKKLLDDYPHSRKLKSLQAASQAGLGNHSITSSNKQFAYKNLQAARDIQDQLVREYPQIPEYRASLAATMHQLAIYQEGTDSPRSAIPIWQSSITIQKQLVAEFPKVAFYRHHLAASQNSLANLYSRLGESELFEKECGEALDNLQILTIEFPLNGAFATALGGTLCNYAHFLRETNRPAEAQKYYEDAIAVLKSLAKKSADEALANRFLRNAYWGRAELLTNALQFSEAAVNWGHAAALESSAEKTTFQLQQVECLLRSAQVDKGLSLLNEIRETASTPIQRFLVARCFAIASVLQSDLSLADRALSNLRESLLLGYQNKLVLFTAEFRHLKGHIEYQRLVEMYFPAEMLPSWPRIVPIR